MAKFLDSLFVEEISDSVFQTTQIFRYESDFAGLITVPALFYTDFASVPRLGVIYAMLGDMAHEPAVVHDWLYYSAFTPRDVADKVLLEAMGVINIPWWRKWPIYWGVRAGGWASWNAHRQAGHPEVGKFSNSF